MTLGRACLLLLATATASCSNRKIPPVPAQDSGPQSSTSLTPELSSQVLARVGDRSITVGEYVAALEHMDQFDRMRYQAPERRQELLGEMVDVMLLADYAREKGYDKEPLTQQEIREILRDAMLRKAHEDLTPSSDIPEAEVRAYYEAHKPEFRDPERRRVSAIVLSSEAAANMTLDSARRATPVQWGELVRARSVDSRAKADVPGDLAGDFGFVSPPGDARGSNPSVPDEIRAAVFEIGAPGDVLPRVVKSGGRFYVVKLAARTEPHDRSLEDVERAIRVRIMQDRIRAKDEALVDSLRSKYTVEIDEAALAEVHVDTPRLDAGR